MTKPMRMKLSLTFYFLVIICCTLQAQEQFKITYLKGGNRYPKQKCTLTYKDGVSHFESEQKNEIVKNDNYELENDYDKVDVYYTPSDSTVYFQRILGNDKVDVFSFFENDVEWIILDEKKQIGNYTAQKAKRKPFIENSELGDAFVYFTTEIPVGTGPYLNLGLPGLVLEAGNENSSWGYWFESIEFESQEKKDIVLHGKQLTPEQIKSPYSIGKKELKKIPVETKRF